MSEVDLSSVLHGRDETSGTSAAPNEVPGRSVSDQLIALRTAALDDLAAAQASCVEAQQGLARSKARRTRAAAVALDTGVDVDIVAKVVGVSDGTVRNWAKALEEE